MSTATCSVPQASDQQTWMEKINGPYHKQALYLYTAIVLAHWCEHLAQAIQIYVLGWPIPESRGVLGLWFPWMIKSELLHYGYALVMLVAFWILRKGFVGQSYRWWMLAFWIQFWHHIEHALLQGQAIFRHNLFDSPVPVSILQLLIPRVELHLFYNTVVFIPMVIAMFYHMFPLPGEAAHQGCSCAWQPRTAPATAASA
ncbi:hypothetical protein FYK55_12760 [Roseiconus nitratireducens]|uniref:Transmembrane protein n=1 Tax=Roseiconus nitratireducens TaxID=2605748 RepID=A0A5M6D6J0_9BACT|nr:hypothetical protein [Roseiconus nitratireducens]KAA5543148.1 hypothetical protein FYK55_12760 [Roseiconus nitratireducens]